MGEVSQTRIVRFAQTIKAAAKVCPFCRAVQSRFGLWREQLIQIVLALLLLGLFVRVCYWVFPEGASSSGRKYARHREDLGVLRSSLEREKKKPKFWLTGYVTNRGDYPWRVRELESRFLDHQGNLLDVRHSTISDPFVVSPRGEGAFRVGLGELVFTNSGVIHQVRVQTATDGNIPAKPD